MMTMTGKMIFYRRHLPHYQIDNSYYFITYRLKNSLTLDLINRLSEEFFNEKKIVLGFENKIEKERQLYNLQKKYFCKFDYNLDRSLTCVNYLSDDRIAKIVCDAMMFLDGKSYSLISYCVMPNHVHMLIHIERFLKPLYRIMQSIKRYTARESNKIINLSGSFWQQENFDHIVRNFEEFRNIINYIKNNPRKAGITNNSEDWKWNYLKSHIICCRNSFYTLPLHIHL